jgi:hypothetical protein
LDFEIGALPSRNWGKQKPYLPATLLERKSRSGDAGEIVLPLADFPRNALHLGFEDLVGDPVQEFQGGSHRRAPCRCVPINHGAIYSLLAGTDVIAITGFRFSRKLLMDIGKLLNFQPASGG